MLIERLGCKRQTWERSGEKWVPKIRRDCKIAERGIKKTHESLHTGSLPIRASK